MKRNIIHTYYFHFTGEVYYTERAAWLAIGVVFAAILPILMCIICAVYCYRKRARKINPGWKLSLPRSRAGSRTTLRNLASDGSDTDTLKKSRSFEKVYKTHEYRTHEPLEGKPNVEFPAKKWDLDEEDFTSSEGGSEFPQGKAPKEISYIGEDAAQQQERQTGRRNQRPVLQQPDTIQEEAYLAQPAESSPGFSPVYSGFGGARSRPPSGGIRVLPPSNKFFSDNTGSPVSASSGSPVLTQNVGLPSPPLNSRATEV